MKFKRFPWGLVIILVLPFLFLIVGTFSAITTLLFLSNRTSTKTEAFTNNNSQATFNPVYQLYSAPPPVLGAFTASAKTTDARAVTLEQFFAKYHSPLADYAQDLIELADKYGLPWQLLPAISMQESLGGKNIPEDSYNPFGWGINSSSNLKFSSWREAIDKVAKGFKERYLDNGLVTVDQIMSKYNPISYNRDGSWGNGVQFFLNEIRSFNTP